MKITLKNKELAPAINFLQGLKLKNADSRHRSKLVKLLVKAFEELSEEEQELLKKYDLLDNEGAIKESEEQDITKAKEFKKEQSVLMDEEVVIEGGMYAKNIDELPRILNEIDVELDGNEAEIYDRLLDEMEKEDAE